MLSPLSVQILPPNIHRWSTSYTPNFEDMSATRSFKCLRISNQRRFLSTSLSRRQSPLGSGPAPPRLPEAEQKRFEELQRASTGAFSTPRPTPQVNQSLASSSPGRTPPQVNQSPAPTSTSSVAYDKDAGIQAQVIADGKGEELHPNIRRGALPEFEGDKNPKTGEVGGPKNDPLRWQGDWAYNGRVTDF